MGHGILLSAAEAEASAGSDIDFMIHGVFSYEIFGQTVWITTTHVCLLIVMLIIIGFCLAANRAVKKAGTVPTGFLNVVELIVEMLDGMIKSAMGSNATKFANYIGTLFLFIFISNISGLIGLRPPTADYGVTLALALITFCMIHFNKFKYQHVSGVIKGLCDPWVFWAPINIIGDIAVPVSLSLRLFANILSGTAIMALVYGLLGWIATAWPAALHIYFDLFSGAIQTYVFCMLTMTYVNDAIGSES
ncbi:MAG: F0F1 ATP synthase subunit A [Lachnospiraceae bacterium]|nr:F0F1 ATP synthase subunit A [Lachnospiraceae bacterium]